MRVFIIAVVVVVAALAGGASLLPMSVAADMAASRFPDFKFRSASGSVWDGKLTQVAFGSQFEHFEVVFQGKLGTALPQVGVCAAEAPAVVS